MRVRGATLVGLALCVAGVAGAQPPAAPTRVEELQFREVAAEWQAGFRHHHGGSGERYMVETMVGGIVIFDFDADGDEDLFFVDGGSLPGYKGEPAVSKLLRNDGGRFIDWTDRAGLRVEAYGVGGTAGDIDGDRDLDLYVTAFGANQMFLNQGDGTFTDVTQASGTADERWNASAAFADVDRDGDLDLYVAGYTDFTIETHKVCRTGELIGYCQPEAYRPIGDRLFRNQGDGRFLDDSGAAGIEALSSAAGLGVVFGDLDEDRWPDLYVANDQYPNLLLQNKRDGTFDDVSLLSGVAYSDTGAAEAGMGVDMGDVDGDGHLDIMVTNFELETNALYKNMGGALFVDSRWVSDIAEPSYLFLAFGVDLADLDLDGDLDMVVANGHINDTAPELLDRSTYEQRNQVFQNDGSGRFKEVDAGLDVVRVSRGLASADLDGDGDLDLVVVNSNDLAEVYENRLARERPWLLVDLDGSKSNRHGIDAWLALEAGGRRQVRHVRTASSYLSQNALSAHFGLGEVQDATAVLTIDWPSGRSQRWLDLPAYRRLRISE